MTTIIWLVVEERPCEPSNTTGVFGSKLEAAFSLFREWPSLLNDVVNGEAIMRRECGDTFFDYSDVRIRIEGWLVDLS